MTSPPDTPPNSPSARRTIYQRIITPVSRPVVIELLIITLLGLLYFSLFLPLAQDLSFIGTEHERLAGIVLAAKIGLNNYGHLPNWNPYIGIGEPFWNDAFNYLLNPVSSLPLLLMDGVTGSKVSFCLTLLIAGYNMWAFGYALGVGSLARVTMGALYMMSGGIAGKFYPGHFQLGLSLAWVPLVFATLWWTLHSRDRRAPVCLAIAFALLFFAGNIYYTLHTLLSCFVIVVFHLFSGWRLRWDRVRRLILGGVFAFGLAALQFMPIWSVQDSIAGGHGSDLDLHDRYSFDQAVINMTTPFEDWRKYESSMYGLFPGVDYNYVGSLTTIPVAAAGAVLLFGWWMPRRFQLKLRAALIALILAVIMLIWGTGQSALLQYLYANVSLLAEFRYIGRALAITGLWWIVLGGLSIDFLWKMSADLFRTPLAFESYDRVRLMRAAVLGIAVWLAVIAKGLQNAVVPLPPNPSLITTIDFYRLVSGTYRDQNAPLWWQFVVEAAIADTILLFFERLLPTGKHLAAQHEVGWRAFGTRLSRIAILAVVTAAIANMMQVNSHVFLFGERVVEFKPLYDYVREHDPSTPIPAVNEPDTQETAFESYYNEVRQWGLDEGWHPPPLPNFIVSGELLDLPRWAIGLNSFDNAVQGYQIKACISTTAAARRPGDCTYSGRFDAALYYLPQALPYAFVAPAGMLINHADRLTGQKVGQVAYIIHQQDTIFIDAQTTGTGSPEYLVVQETNFPGWLAFIDGAAVETVSFDRFIGIRMLPGLHTYTLRYQPPGLATGLVIFLVTIVGIGLHLGKRTPKRTVRQNE
jgi:hypothetical protein